MAIDEVKAFMLEQFGPPALSIRGISSETKDVWESKGYYIDRF
jgi:hypothetical protein